MAPAVPGDSAAPSHEGSVAPGASDDDAQAAEGGNTDGSSSQARVGSLHSTH